ncbi:MAG: CubicO group peptidase (beta-lactamase class C family) [Glaciecola sp.]|jgi:CubicO group peptidase (beta-lactamase class C family)
MGSFMRCPYSPLLSKSMISASLAFALLLLVPQDPVASAPVTAVPIEAPSTDPLFKAIDGTLKKAAEDGTVVGHSALVFQDGEVLYYGQFGDRDRKKALPMRRDSIFRIYSMTKPITSVAAMQLVEAGKLKLDEPVATYLPEFADMKVLRKKGKLVKARRPMTVRDLMRHTSGLTYGFFGTTPVDQMYKEQGVLVTDTSLKGLVEKLAKMPLQSHPKLRFHYSVSTDVLARVVEVASGEEFSAYLKKHIFDPLGMHDTFFTVPKDKLERLVEMYVPTKEGFVPAPARQSYHFINDSGFHSGGGGLCSTIDDYLQFCRVLIQDGSHAGHRILKPESLAQMFTNQLEGVRYSANWFQFGLGFYIEPKLGDYSWAGTAGTSFWVNPERKLAILYMAQINPWGERAVGDKLRQMTYEALKE